MCITLVPKYVNGIVKQGLPCIFDQYSSFMRIDSSKRTITVVALILNMNYSLNWDSSRENWAQKKNRDPVS